MTTPTWNITPVPGPAGGFTGVAGLAGRPPPPPRLASIVPMRLLT